MRDVRKMIMFESGEIQWLMKNGIFMVKEPVMPWTMDNMEYRRQAITHVQVKALSKDTKEVLFVYEPCTNAPRVLFYSNIVFDYVPE